MEISKDQWGQNQRRDICGPKFREIRDDRFYETSVKLKVHFGECLKLWVQISSETWRKEIMSLSEEFNTYKFMRGKTPLKISCSDTSQLFPNKSGIVSDNHGKCFHQDIFMMEKQVEFLYVVWLLLEIGKGCPRGEMKYKSACVLDQFSMQLLLWSCYCIFKLV
jgi:hypothetical protein